MNPHLRTGRSHWLQVRAVIFGIAVFNFALVWTMEARMGGLIPFISPWYPSVELFERTKLPALGRLVARNRSSTERSRGNRSEWLYGEPLRLLVCDLALRPAMVILR